MTHVNTGLKRVFTVFNFFFAVVGALVISLALHFQLVTHVEGPNIQGGTSALAFLYLFGTVTMAIATLGAYGAHRESKAALIVFLVCMVVGSLLMLFLGILSVLARTQLEGIQEKKFQEFLPLDEAGEDVRKMADTLQTQLHCCGLFSSKDWGQQIPASCVCDAAAEDDCRPLDYSALTLSQAVYSKPCFPILMHYVLLGADITHGVLFTLAVLALLGMTLSSIMIHQMRFPNRPTFLLSIPAAFATLPPGYQELHKPAAY